MRLCAKAHAHAAHETTPRSHAHSITKWHATYNTWINELENKNVEISMGHSMSNQHAKWTPITDFAETW